MRAMIFVLSSTLFAATAAAQDRDRSQGIPPGHLPPPGECRVWYDGRPPGQQPPPTDCWTAERRAWQDRNARVIYGGTTGRDDNRGGDERWRSDPRRDSYPDGRNGAGDDWRDIAAEYGYRDGIQQGERDARDNRAYSPQRSTLYRQATRGYDGRSGSRGEYQRRYRDGFEAGYDEGFNRADQGGARRRHP